MAEVMVSLWLTTRRTIGNLTIEIMEATAYQCFPVGTEALAQIATDGQCLTVGGR